MAVPEQTPYQEFIANGSTNRFDLNFLCKKKEHLIVKLNDAEANVGDWTFTNNAVVFSTTPASGVKVSIQRRTPNKRSANYQSYNSSFSPNAVNEDFDALWMRLQEEEVAKAFLNQLIEMNYEDLDEKSKAIRLELINQLTEKTTQLNQTINNKTSQLDQKIQSNALQLQNQIIQQGVSQQQIDAYAKKMMNDIANISTKKGWLADLIIDGDKTQKQINLKIKKTVSVSEYGILGDGSNEGAKLALMFGENQEKGTRFDFQGLTVANDRIHVFTRRHKFELFNGEVKALYADVGNFTFTECRNYKLTDFIADGCRDIRSPGEVASKHNVKIFGGENFEFSNVDIVNGLCENLYIGISPGGEIPKKGYFYGLNLDNSFRNNLGLIDGFDLFFDNYEFTDANGTSPQAGIDLESNDRTGATTISNIRFGRGKCTGNMGHQVLITQYGNPKDIDLGEMIMSAPRDSLGGIFTFTSLNLSKITFKDFKGTQYTDNNRLQFCIRTGLSENFINLSQAKFVNMADGVQGIRSHSSVVGTRSLGYVMNGCEFDDVGNNFLQPNFKLNIHKNNIVYSCRGTWLVGDKVSNRYIEAVDNHIFNCAGQAIISEADDAKIVGNHIYDCMDKAAWIRVVGPRSIVDGNKCFSETLLASTIRAIIVNSSVSSFQNNYADPNFTSTSALYNSDASSSRNVGLINKNNVSINSINDGLNIARSPETIAKYSTANRPSANAVPSGTKIYDTSLTQELTSNGSIWLLPTGAKVTSAKLALTSETIAANSSIIRTIEVMGLTLGDFIVCSYSRGIGELILNCEVSASNMVTVKIYNPTISDIVLPSGEVFVKAT